MKIKAGHILFGPYTGTNVNAANRNRGGSPCLSTHTRSIETCLTLNSCLAAILKQTPWSWSHTVILWSMLHSDKRPDLLHFTASRSSTYDCRPDYKEDIQLGWGGFLQLLCLCRHTHHALMNLGSAGCIAAIDRAFKWSILWMYLGESN